MFSATPGTTMPRETTSDSVCRDAIARMPVGRFLMTAAFGDTRSGMIVTQVQKCANEPPTITVSVRKGNALSPLIRDSGTFALCEIAETDLVLSRLFRQPSDLQGEDPFLGHPLLKDTQNVPVPIAAASWVRCELLRHLDIEADHEIYIGRVIQGGILDVVNASSKNGTRRVTARSTGKAVLAINGAALERHRPGIDEKTKTEIEVVVQEDPEKTRSAN
jgi:flavin reductase (DIM6/NTAB) family NADH-FMN oxidoreductase RutF